MNNEMSNVAKAVEPLRADAMERAREEAQGMVDRILKRYAEDNTIAVYPSRMKERSTHEYESKMRAYTLICAVTSQVKHDESGNWLPGARISADVKIGAGRVASPEKIQAFIEQCVKQAEAAYTAFIYKLEVKIGECDSAELSGSHVWGYSTLTVTKGEAVELWRTQQIVNVSKKGLPFNQWPTRKVKA